jgi:hypothetical protein
VGVVSDRSWIDSVLGHLKKVLHFLQVVPDDFGCPPSDTCDSTDFNGWNGEYCYFLLVLINNTDILDPPDQVRSFFRFWKKILTAKFIFSPILFVSFSERFY